MHKLVLVKHSMPEIERDKPASTWRLGDVGRRRAGVLADRLRSFNVDLIWSSREPKAVETADILATTFSVPVKIADGLEEHHRDDVPFLPKRDFQCAVEAFFRHPDQLVLGSETAKQACERFTASIENVIKTGQKDSIVVAHGTVISLFAASVAKVHPIDLWHQLDLPSFVVFALPSMDIQEIVGNVATPNVAD